MVSDNCVSPPIFALDLLEDGDVANRSEEQDARPDFDGVAAKNVVDGGVAVEHDLADLNQSLP